VRNEQYSMSRVEYVDSIDEVERSREINFYIILRNDENTPLCQMELHENTRLPRSGRE
jgi:hypothetical protein